MSTKYRDCRVDLSEYKSIILPALSQLNNIIKYDTSIADEALQNIAVNDVKTLKSILNTRGLQNAKHIVYIPEDHYAILETYYRYNQQRILVKQALSYDGITRIQQAVPYISVHKLLGRLHMCVIQLWNMLRGYESSADDIYALLSTCGVGICQKYVEYPLPDSYSTPDRPAYKTKDERNSAIIQMYLEGTGLRQLENAGFGIKRAAIRSVLQKSGVYKGANEGKERHQSGNWRTSGLLKYNSASSKAIKIAKSKHSTVKRRRKVLFELRSHSALTQQQIADLLGCSKSYYCNVENGRENPSEVFWSNIAELYGLVEGYEEIRKVSTIRQTSKTQGETEQVNINNIVVDDEDNLWNRYERPFLV